MRARYPSIQGRSDNEDALRHVLTSACEQIHVDYSNTSTDTPPPNGSGENTVRTMKDMIQSQKESVNTLGDQVFRSVSFLCFARASQRMAHESLGAQ